MQNAKTGFEPCFNKDSRILILGSFPSVRSREVKFYYGNKQNRFWSMMYDFFGGSVADTEGKKKLLFDNGIALWDIVAECEIVGSSDSAIKNFRLAELAEVLNFSSIEKILCNGQKSFFLTSKAYTGDLPVICLPSTSPANTRFDCGEWRQQLLDCKKESNDKS